MNTGEYALRARVTQMGLRVRKVMRKPQFWFGFATLVPVLAYYILFSFRPIFRAFWMAVVDYKILHPKASEFVGLANFQQAFEYDLFWISVRNTLVYDGIYILVQLPMAIFVSVCLTTVVRGRRFYQWAVFLPVVVSLVAVSLLFRMLMEPQHGTLNRIIRSLGMPTFPFLTSKKTALYSVIGVDLWKGLGYYVVLISTAMLNIPEEYYEAAKVDGASSWQNFRHITVPLLSNTVALVLALMVIYGLQVYTSVTVLPGEAGGPARATYVMNLLVVTEAFNYMRFGLATAISFTLFLFILLVTVIQLRLTRRAWTY